MLSMILVINESRLSNWWIHSDDLILNSYTSQYIPSLIHHTYNMLV